MKFLILTILSLTLVSNTAFAWKSKAQKRALNMLNEALLVIGEDMLNEASLVIGEDTLLVVYEKLTRAKEKNAKRGECTDEQDIYINVEHKKAKKSDRFSTKTVSKNYFVCPRFKAIEDIDSQVASILMIGMYMSGIEDKSLAIRKSNAVLAAAGSKYQIP